MTWEDYNYLDVLLTRWLDDVEGPKLPATQVEEAEDLLDFLRKWLSANVD